jgi:phosphatidate phosphatase APP1
MPDWGDWVSRVLTDVSAASRSARDMALRRVPGEDPHALLMYRGIGNSEGVWVYGRAVRDPGTTELQAGQSRWRNLADSLRRIHARPLPHARVRLSVRGVSRELEADDEGFLEAWIAAPGGGEAPTPGEAPAAGAAPAPIHSHGALVVPGTDDGWTPIEGELLAPLARGVPVRSRAEALAPLHRPEMVIISDVDDTVLQSSVTNLMAAAKVMLLENARTRLPFPGVTAFYEALRDGAAGDARNPIVYVSSSPWNLYDLITGFMDVQGIPRGPVLLRDIDLGLNILSSAHHHDHKREAVRRVLRLFGDVPAILIGDSGQQDPEIYRDVVHEFPDRIRAVYIRDVTLHPERSAAVQGLAEEVLAAGSSLVMDDDTLSAARHAAEHGWIREAAVERVRQDKRADEGKTPGKAETGLEPESEGDGPPLIVE